MSRLRHVRVVAFEAEPVDALDGFSLMINKKPQPYINEPSPDPSYSTSQDAQKQVNSEDEAELPYVLCALLSDQGQRQEAVMQARGRREHA